MDNSPTQPTAESPTQLPVDKVPPKKFSFKLPDFKNLNTRSKLFILAGVIIVVLSALVILLPKPNTKTQTASNQNSMSLMDNARLEEKKGNLDKAREYLIEALKLDKNNPKI